MLSPGQWHKLVPKDPLKNLIFRQWLVETAKKDKQFRRALVLMCKQDILFYINCFVWQYNPDNIDHEVEPFITYPFQDHAILGGDVEVDGEMVHVWGILACPGSS